jgi:polyisoprenyl-phosphate glycosyltransferase
VCPEPIEISVVVPVYQCRDCLTALHDRLTRTLEQLVDSWEIVLVDDRSVDGSWERVVELAAADPRVKAIRLSRNFGQHAAITAGVSESTGRWTVVMDCDLQDPPEAIPDLYARALEGHDIVLARRRTRRQTLARRAANRVYFMLRHTLAGVDLETEHSNLSMMSAKARAAFLSVPDVHRNFLLILYWLGFDRTTIEFDHADRFAGKTSYGFTSLLAVALDGLFFQTTTLLRWIVYFGFGMAASSAVLAVYFVYQYFSVATRPGWTSLAVLLLLIGGFVIISVGLTGLYLGKVFDQVKGRPLFVVDERVQGGLPTHELELSEVGDRPGDPA